LYGYDVLASALHLTASTLSMRSPETKYRRMNLYCMPHGGEDNRLGSIEFLAAERTQAMTDLFIDNSQRVEATAVTEVASAPLHMLDLCVMNPPFTRSVGNNLLFGSVPKAKRALMRRKLSRILTTSSAHASITAGLGSVFTAVADDYVKDGGILALVLPKSLLSGVAWKVTRDMLTYKYVLEWIISSHDPRMWNFSENTSLSEVMVILRKVGTTNRQDDQEVRVLNLWENP